MADDKNFTTQLLVDTMNDLKTERKFLKKLCAFLCGFIVLLIIGIVATSIYNQKKIFDFINETDISSSVEVNNDDSTNYGTITVK